VVLLVGGGDHHRLRHSLLYDDDVGGIVGTGDDGTVFVGTGRMALGSVIISR
jgi:hypothetical protein